jgi:hypothetical protein
MLTFLILLTAALSPLWLDAALSDPNPGSWEDQNWGDQFTR